MHKVMLILTCIYKFLITMQSQTTIFNLNFMSALTQSDHKLNMTHTFYMYIQLQLHSLSTRGHNEVFGPCIQSIACI